MSNKNVQKKVKNLGEEFLFRVLPAMDKIASATENGVHQTANFLKKESPEVAKEIVRWGVLDSLVPFVFSVLFASIGWAWIIVLYLKGSVGWYYYIVPGFIIFVGTIIMIQSTEWLKPLLTPRLYLLEWLQDKIKK